MRQMPAALILLSRPFLSEVSEKLQIARPVFDVPEEVNYLLANIGLIFLVSCY